MDLTDFHTELPDEITKEVGWYGKESIPWYAFRLPVVDEKEKIIDSKRGLRYLIGTMGQDNF